MPKQLMRAVYYRDSDGCEPVRDFVDGLPARCQLLLDNQIDLLNGLTTSDPPLAFPHSSQVRGDLRELRCHCGRDLYRILSRRSLNLFLLLHIFRKGAIPEDPITIAEDRLPTG
jgi:phage-related protein